MSEYRASIDALFARTGGAWKFGLDTTRALLATIGNPHERYPAFQVGGTNGKGSTVYTLDALLRARGLRVGRYTSPHLVDFRERIAVDGVPMSETAIVGWLGRYGSDIARLDATFFESTTCMALDHFAAEGVDVAIVEVGLGGRLDATNVLTPVVAGITSIGVDHTEYLGNTIDSIAREKAGIFKTGVPAAIAEPDPHVRGLLAQLAHETGASPVVVTADRSPATDIVVSAHGTSFTAELGGVARRLTTSLIGRQQASNTVLALSMLELAGPPFDAAAAMDSALATVRVPGRFDWRTPYLFDVAHNPDSAATLRDALLAVQPPRPLVALFGVLADKDWRAMMEILAPVIDRFVLTEPPSAPSARAWRVDEAAAFARSRGWNAEEEPDFDRAMERAREGAATTLVTGSFHTVGDCLSRLQGSQPVG